MNGVTEIASRIQQLQGQLGIAAATARPVSSAAGKDFATTLDAARASGTAGDKPQASGPSGQDVVAGARKYLGVPYVFGGNNPATGLDCSSLVQRVYADLGIKLPRLVRHQRLEGQPVASLAQAKPGDLLVFKGYQHIGIYIGDGKMIHAPQPGEKVKVAKVYETPTSIRRIVQDAPAAATAPLLRPAALQSAQVPGSVPYANLFAQAGARHGVSPTLLAAVAKVESGYNPRAVSPAGAQGLMQIMPGTAAGLKVNPLDPAQAVDGAARLLARDLKSFGSLPLALAAYNAGAGAVRRHGGIPPYAETQAYVKKVQAAMAAVGSKEH